MEFGAAIASCAAGRFLGVIFVFGSYLYGRARGQTRKRLFDLGSAFARLCLTTLYEDSDEPRKKKHTKKTAR